MSAGQRHTGVHSSEAGSVFPVLPVKNTVLFPYVVLPLAVGRPRSIAAVEAAVQNEDKMLVVVAQRDASVNEPGPKDLFTIGTRSVIKKTLRSEGMMQVIVQGLERVVLLKSEQEDPYLLHRTRQLSTPDDAGTEQEALLRGVVELAGKMAAIVHPETMLDLGQLAERMRDPTQMTYLLASMVSLDVEKEQALLEASTLLDALRLMYSDLSHELEVLELRRKIASQVQTEMSKQEHDYVLRQQMRAIQQELGDQSPESAEVEGLRGRLSKAALPEDVRKEAERELGRLERTPPVSPDHQVSRNYLELVLELPWTKTTTDNLDLARARQILDADHYGLSEIKDRILEQLAVMKLNPKARAPILCFVGPPGVGKTSLGQSIARALGRNFERMSLGGLHDEAELRGHRRTYVGAMAGRIIQAIRRAGVANPLLMLDEVDKLGKDFRGDPAAALMEILDPAQNVSFRDNYLDLPFDLSRVFFITTANTLDPILQPLRDRMEILGLSGYTEQEKLEIARRYLVPRQLADTGLTGAQLILTDEAITGIIGRYTREAGVRQLERTIGSLSRKVALRFAQGDSAAVTVGPADLDSMLGPERFFLEQARASLPPGVATGLAWTETGGDVMYVEAMLLSGGRGMTLTGQLGEVMKESARAARSWVWSMARTLGIRRTAFRTSGVHIHIPAGAIPKDGPSAGVTLAVALASLHTGQAVRRDTAMTGEVTLTGLVLPVGGIKEKVLAARRAGLRRVVLPTSNRKDLRGLPETIRDEVEFVFVERIEDALKELIPGLVERLEAT